MTEDLSITRRKLLVAGAAAVFVPASAFAALGSIPTRLTALNIDGVAVPYSWELARDIKAVFGWDIEDLFSKLHGTSFSIRRIAAGPWWDTEPTEIHSFQSFELTTNDSRDKPMRWTQLYDKTGRSVDCSICKAFRCEFVAALGA